ncbi:MAG: ParB/RepB/Spo0J family partition protein [Firmicutes bacterium]|nr:ParB/RepB/Spo0J family partition protein [Bacillota bacterium]
MKLSDVLLNRKRREVSQEQPGGNWKEDVQALPIHIISTGKFQPRREFDTDALRELAESIKVHGLLHPVVVRRAEIGYELIVGERRLRACKELGWEAIPAIVREIKDKEAAELALIENLQREDLQLFEVAEGYQRLLKEFELTQEELGRRLGISQANIANKIRLLKLPPSVRKIISREMLSERHGRCLLKIEEEQSQLRVLKTVIEEGLNVRQTEKLVNSIERKKRPKPKKEKPAVGVRKLVLKDLRLFTNSIRQLTETLKASGLKVALEEKEDEETFQIVVVVKKPQRGE